MEVFITSSATSEVVVEELRTCFARFGLPDLIVTDNAQCFKSDEFESFLQRNGVRHVTSAPYHPASNGLAERGVQILKRGLKKVKSGTLKARVATVLCSYRVTPHATTGVSPSELLLGKRLRTRLDLLKPNTAKKVENKQMQQKIKHDRIAKQRNFVVGRKVFVRNFGQGPKWLPGEVIKSSGPVSCIVQLVGGGVRRCHHDQLRHRYSFMEDTQQELNEGVHSEVEDILPTIQPHTVGDIKKFPYRFRSTIVKR